MSRPLEGIRVLDFSAMLAGPYCTQLLASLGARVIKLEPPEGDYMRSRPPLRDGHSLYFGMVNCGKESVALDLKKEEGRRIAVQLAAACDVVVENFRPGVMRRLGCDHAALSAANPGLVYCSISGYGQEGASSTKPAYAPIVQAASGYDLANLSYQDGLERPLKAGIFTADFLTGVHAFGAINAALVQRGRTGRGACIDCTLMGAMLGMLAYEVAEAQEPVATKRPVYRPCRAADGFVIFAPVTAANFEAMARAAGHAEWLGDPRFATDAARVANWNALMDELDRWTGARSAAECARVMDEAGVPCTRYASVAEVMASPYAAESSLFATVTDSAGEFRVPNPPFRMSGAGAGTRVPRLGEHGARVAAELLGRTPADIELLIRENVLCQAA